MASSSSRRSQPRPRSNEPRPGKVGFAVVQENPMVKRLMWSGLLAGVGALAAVAANRVAAGVWRRVFGEDPPE